MDLNKAIRKQRKSYIRFIISMGFIFFSLPLIAYLFDVLNIFYLLYLILIEVLILISIIAKINNERLSFNCDGTKLRIKSGIKGERLNIDCQKILLIHVEDMNINLFKNYEDFKIIVISYIKVRNVAAHETNRSFLAKYPYIRKFLSLNSQENRKYYYYIIKRGGLNKYTLLDLMYKYCINVKFSQNAIEKIKVYKENTEKN